MNTESLRPPLTGIGNYTLNLLRQFREMPTFEQVGCFNGSHLLDVDEQIQGAVPSDVHEVAASESAITHRIRKIVRGVPGAYKFRSKLVDRRFGSAAKAIPDAIYHDPNFILKSYDGPTVTTVHDLSFIRYPQYHPKERVDWLTEQLPKTLKRADCVITDSEIVRQELIEYFNVPAERTKAVYLGSDEQFHPREGWQVGMELSLLGLEYQSYILFVGTLEPRKGVGVLLDAWCALPESFQRAYPLVLAGSAGWGNSELLSRIQSLADEGRIHYLNYVPVDMLPILYSGAAIFAYPSIYEGFGLPVLEAMSSGVPVICRENTSMAEFAQGSCALCETGEVEELSNKITELLENPVKRKEYARKGLAQATNYSWKRCAEETSEVYNLAVRHAMNRNR